MQKYLNQKLEADSERRKTSIINQHEYYNFYNYDLPLYIFIRDVNENYLPTILKEFEIFGEIKEVKNYDNSILISYSNPDSALIAYKNHNKFLLDPFTKQHPLRIDLLNEETKNKFLENMLEKNYMTDKQELGLDRMNMAYNLPSSRDYTFARLNQEKQKTNFQKFVEVFFNL
jgi:hypothetical protein